MSDPEVHEPIYETDVQLIRWGVHEGIRGAHWLELCTDGNMVRRTYVPNPDHELLEEYLGQLPVERFEELASMALPLLNECGSPQAPAPDPGVCISLEGTGSHSKLEIYVPSCDVSADATLSNIAALFRSYVNELSGFSY